MDRKSITKKVKRSDFLKSVKQRLNNEVNPYFSCILGIQPDTGAVVGFWALVRMIFPVIEALSAGLKTDLSILLVELGIEYPNITWEIYRHSLMHRDTLRYIKYKNQHVGWVIGIGQSHAVAKGNVSLDLEDLYSKLIEYIDKQISSSGDEEIEFETGLELQNPYLALERELDKLLK